MTQRTPDHEALIIGAGFGGIIAAIKLQEAGVADFVVLEGADEVGGTWRVNTYPGIAVDTPSFQYQLASDLNPRWSRVFAPGHELKAYAEQVVDRHGLRDRIRFSTTATAATFVDEDDLWCVALEDGSEVTARYLIPATGGLTTPRYPEIEGIEDFTGKTVHTGEWDHDHDLRSERVAVIGTGATSVQLIPAIADEVGHIDVYQRTPIWVLPKLDADLSRVGFLFERVPGLQRLARLMFGMISEIPGALSLTFNKQVPQLTRACEALGRSHLRRQVPDPELRAKLTPDYGFGCKRPSVSNEYLSSFTRDDVDLVTTPIERITARGLRTSDGREREVDTIIFATGYNVFDPGNIPTIPVYGRDGQELNAFWIEQRYQAYEGTTVPGFPNLFLTFGPYLVPGLSILNGIENSTTHALRVISEARRRGATLVEIRPEANRAYFEHMQRRLRSSVFVNNGCAGANSYYFDLNGDTPLLRPGGTLDAWWSSRHFDLNDYAYGPAHERPESDLEMAAGAA